MTGGYDVNHYAFPLFDPFCGFKHDHKASRVWTSVTDRRDVTCAACLARMLAEVDSALRVIVEAYDRADGNEWDAPLGVHYAIEAARPLGEVTP